MKIITHFGCLTLFFLFFCYENSIFAQIAAQCNNADTNLVKDENVTVKQKPGHVSLGGWIDAQYQYQHNPETENSVFQIRRARIDYKGSLSPCLDFRLHVDFANTPRLIDAFAKITFNKYAQLQVGQFKIPFSLENKLSPLDLELIDNVRVISALSGYQDVTAISSYANGREMGAMLTGQMAYADVQGKRTPLVSYGVGIFGGNGINVKSDNIAKDISARIEVCPYVRNLTVSASGYWGQYDMRYDGAETHIDGARIRYAGGAQYADERWTVRSEFLFGKTDFADYDPTTDSFTPRQVETRGCYLVAGYWFKFHSKHDGIQNRLRPILRVDYYEKAISDNAPSIACSAGADSWLGKNLRLQLAYTLQHDQPTSHLSHKLTTMLTVKF
ncbi:MAG: OprO/OprP family phosphate-selective porin [Bacteroidales bacterium]|nr:OprO/OprP family phosphate-selective porin [Bacteroidales bacterium]